MREEKKDFQSSQQKYLNFNKYRFYFFILHLFSHFNSDVADTWSFIS